MRLIDVNTYRLHEFINSHDQRYAILSHTWETEEVSFQDIQDLERAKQKRGFKKIEWCCTQAKEDGWKWAWVDTCCIDKTSSAELSEAINSMYKWYSDAMVCYAYLVDVRSISALTLAAAALDSYRNSHSVAEELSNQRSPRWFYRGWTLQELIAPFKVVFYGKQWSFLGTKATLKSILTTITGIQPGILDHTAKLYNVPVATRMSWASRRVTMREEDMAYSLLGLFDVNMPLLYGESYKAFERLQEQIILRTDDQTLFLYSLNASFQAQMDALANLTWQDLRYGSIRANLRQQPVFAQAPRDFASYTGDLVHVPGLINMDTSTQFLKFNQGLRLNLPLRSLGTMTQQELESYGFKGVRKHHNLNLVYLAALNCTLAHKCLAKFTEKNPTGLESGNFCVVIVLQSLGHSAYHWIGPLYTIVPVIQARTWESTTCFIVPGESEKSLHLWNHDVELRADAIQGYQIIWRKFSSNSQGESRFHATTIQSLSVEEMFASESVFRFVSGSCPSFLVGCRIKSERIDIAFAETENDMGLKFRGDRHVPGDIPQIYTSRGAASWTVTPLIDRQGPVAEHKHKHQLSNWLEVTVTLIRRKKPSCDIYSFRIDITRSAEEVPIVAAT